MLLAIRLLVAALGLTVPGYLSARALNLQKSWVAAFPLSALLLVQSVILFSVTGVAITFGTVAAALAGWTLLACLLISKRQAVPPATPAASEDDELPRWLRGGCLGVTLLVILALMLRTTLFPLSGYDTFWRWDALARDMLSEKSLWFYPPISAKDFSIYFLPDGIPPLVSTVYWWLYAALGEPLVQVTAVAVVMQLVSALALAYHGARQAFGAPAAYCSLLVFATSTLLINGFAIGQETGYTALSVAGQLCFAGAATRRPRVSLVVAAALFASLGALARDYGPALATTGFLVLAWDRQTRRYLPTFAAITILISAPWYLRNWALTGSPLYPRAMPGGVPINAVFTAIMTYYQEIFGLAHFDSAQWFSLLGELLVGAPLALLIGVPYGIVTWRQTAPLMLSVLLVAFLWLVSIGQTSGGVVYSMRVLTPAFVALSLPAGQGLGRLLTGVPANGNRLRKTVLALGVLCAAYAIISVASHPFPAPDFFSAIRSRSNGQPDFCKDSQELANRLNATDFPTTGVLIDSGYLARILQRDTRFRPVLIWSPEVQFVFDAALDPREIRRRLRQKDIRLVALQAGSIHQEFLARFPFYSQDGRNWLPLLIIPESAAVYTLPQAP
jgi:hypothetical protein